MMVKNPWLPAALLILSWIAPHATALGIHMHESLAHHHHHHGPATAVVHVHAEHHDHDTPSVDQEPASRVRPATHRVAPSPPVIPIFPAAGAAARHAVTSPATAIARGAPRDGPSLLTLHCSFLI